MTAPSLLHERIGKKKILLGCAIESASPAAAELAATIGYDIIWADMEHYGVGFREVEAAFQAARSAGAMSILRIPSAERPHILGALDAGSDMLMVPMVEKPETARQMVEYGKFKPLGNRGFVGSSRGMGFGLHSPVETMERANRETHLFIQIETAEGVRRAREILSVEGIAGVVVGPADLSISLGMPLAFDNTAYLEIFSGIIRTANELGKLVVIPAGHAGLAKVAVEAGAHILITSGERGALKAGWKQNIQDMGKLIGSIAPRNGN